jgi:carbon monoxide dehydrogenase subunit G
MELTNDFRVALPVDRAWVVLTDLERIAPCMPGAQLQEVEGDDYRGVVKVKVGPITAQYKGQATFVDRDEANHVAVLRAEGRETRGQGNASATITATLTPDGDGTAVSVVTDLTVTGRVAQFGRGVLADVSAKLLGQFVDCLEQTVLADETSPPEPTTAAPEPASGDEAHEAVGPATSGEQAAWPTEAPAAHEPAPAVAEAPSATPGAARRVDHPEAQPVDLISTAGTPVAKRVGPILALVAIAWLLKKLLSRSKK